MISLLKNRATVRQYSDKNISEELLIDLLEASFRSSNTGNMQVYSVVVTRDEEMKKQLAPCHFNQPMIVQAPIVLTFVPILTGLLNGVNTTKPFQGMIIFCHLLQPQLMLPLLLKPLLLLQSQKAWAYVT